MDGVVLIIINTTLTTKENNIENSNHMYSAFCFDYFDSPCFRQLVSGYYLFLDIFFFRFSFFITYFR